MSFANVDSMLDENLMIEHTENEFQESVYCDGDSNPTPDEAKTYVEVTNISPHYFDFLKLIGEGAFGKVFLVKNKLNDKLFAMKVISKKVLKKKNNISYMKSERDILLKMNHPFIVSLWHAFQTEKKLFLVMDFLAGGEFFFHLRRRGLILEKEIKFYLGEMILALEFLHNLNIIHRDLKPENILLRADGHVCLTDFGLAKDFGTQEKAKTFCGTSEYMAPEMLTRNGYSTSVDWWALGTLCFEMLTGKPPFTAKAEKDLFKKIVSEKLVCPSYLSATTHSLLKGLLEKDVNKRLGCMKSNMFSIGGVTALKQHEFFVGMDWIALYKCELQPPIDLGLQSISRSLTQSPDINHNSNNMTVISNGHINCSNGNNNNNTYNNTNNTTTKNSGNGLLLTENDFLTMHFHEGFTTQAINLSILEDSNSIISSSSYARSIANGTDDGNTTNTTTTTTANNTYTEEYELYSGFDYSGTPLTCTHDKMKQVLADIANTTAKMNKKLKLKAKKEEEKLADQEAKIKLKLNLDAQKQEAEKLQKIEKDKEILQAFINKQHQQQLLIISQYECQLKQYHEAKVRYEQELDKFQKKMKMIKKKLRDITDLEKKIQDYNNSNSNSSNNSNGTSFNSSSNGTSNKNNSMMSLTKEQKEKLQSKGNLLLKLQEIEDEESEYIDVTPEPTPPPPLSAELLALQQEQQQQQLLLSSSQSTTTTTTTTITNAMTNTATTTNATANTATNTMMPLDLNKMNFNSPVSSTASAAAASSATTAVWSTPAKTSGSNSFTAANVLSTTTTTSSNNHSITTTPKNATNNSATNNNSAISTASNGNSNTKITTPSQSHSQPLKTPSSKPSTDSEWATVPVKSASSSAKKKGGAASSGGNNIISTK